MARIIRTLCLTLLLLPLLLHPATAAENITLNLPESVIADAITAMLPYRIDAHSKSIQGDITVVNISQLAITRQHFSCRLQLTGNNLAFLTEIAGHEIKLKVGSVEINFKANAAVRFDTAKQTLYIKPVVENITSSGDSKNGEIGQALIALLNGREFPVSLQKIDPLVAKAGGKTVTIMTRITDIQAKKDLLQLTLTPSIASKTNKKHKTK